MRLIRADHVGAIVVDAARHTPAWAGIFHRVGITGTELANIMLSPTTCRAACRPLARSQIAASASV